MIRNFKRKIAVLGIIALCFSSIYSGRSAVSNAAALGSVVLETSIDTGSKLEAIKMDDQRGYLYATAYETSQLLLINKDNLQIEKRLAVGSQPRGMDMMNNKLYVALSGATFIAVVNLDTQTLEAPIPTKEKPYQVAVDGNSLYYATGDQWCNIHRIDLLTGKDTIIENLIYEPKLVVDRETHLLFAGEEGITNPRVSAYLATYGEKIWSKQGGTPLLVNDGNIYAGSKRDQRTGRMISSNMEGILAIDDLYVYTRLGVYTKDEGINVVTYSDNSNDYTLLMVVDHSRNVFNNDSGTTVIRKRSLNLPTVTPKAIEYQNGQDVISLDHGLNALVMGQNEKYLYAVSKDTNRLLQIDSESFKVIADRYIGSYPVDVDIRNGIIYVALSGSSHIAKIDTVNESNFMAPITELEVGEPTKDVAAGIGKVYYVNSSSWGNIGVFDSVYKNYPVSYSTPHLTMNADSSILYIGESGTSRSQLYKMDTTTGAILQQTTDGDNSGTKEIIEDSGYVYYGARRLAANDLSTVYGQYKYGYYSAHLLFAKGNLVLGTDAIYDRDTFNPIFKLPFTAGYGYIKKDGKLILFTGNGSQFVLSRFDSFDSLKGELVDGMRPVDAFFIDEDWDPLMIDGDLTIIPGPAAVTVNSYCIRYYDASNNPVTGVFDDYIHSYEKQSDGSFVHKLSKSLPKSVKRIGIIPVISKDFENSVLQLDSQRIIRLWDYDTYYVENPQLLDYDTSLASIGGKVSFEASVGEISGDSYEVSFEGEDGSIGEPIGIIAGSGQAYYVLSIPLGTIIPDGAIAIGVHLLDHDGSRAPGYSLVEILDRMTLAPQPSQITVVNALGAADSVKVVGLNAGDRVRVYSYFGELYGEKTVASGQTLAEVNGLNLSDEFNVLLVTVTSPGKHESFYVVKDYPSSNGSSGGGSPDGGSPGGGSLGGGGGLPSIVTPVVDKSNSSKLAVTEVSKNADGSSEAIIKLDDKVLETELANWSGKANTMTIQLTESADVMKVTLGGSQLSKIIGKDKDAVLQIQGAESGFVIPAGFFGESGTDAEKTDFILTMAPLKGLSAEAAQKLLVAQKIQQVGQPYEFSISKQISGGAAVELTTADRYIGHIITINKPVQSGETLSAVMIDASGGQVIPVPVVFMQDGDKITATIYRKGNSVYSLVAGQGEFKDVPATNFAKTAIDKLAVRTVVKGYSDGSFKPDTSVTRAEAATMLVKALGILPTSGTSGFKDVKQGAWYAEAVTAAVQAGLLKGYTDGSFKPDQTITQQEMVAILYQALLYGGNQQNSTGYVVKFDTSAGYKTWSAEAVDVVLKAGIVKIKDAFSIQANKVTTRAESAEMIYRMLSALKLI
ncbi:S-layer homology domain-containing protein [Paenibacillus sp. 19GGS1-52]|uniref:S-layer homology domain-containing protein n=1 Tax=Paenibacillus sp. 19GGS1-52 TaxID=2758563 RepID=UPI001EFC05E9|nr:S-layer homology domain-containing protein [Paenibacillus sp. 19GGS1-52]ULO05220.1 S-layer homology domain-containing protein [Paenibacillus sp. 19GGS1-52]